MSNKIEVRRVSWAEARETLMALRTAVFVVEQGVAETLERDGNDPEANHFLCLLNDEPVGCARLQDSGKISRMCVLQPYRGLNCARHLLEAIIAEARAMGMPRLFLHAQAHAAGLYRQSGFEVYGDPFDEAEIPHIAMALTLAPDGAPVQIAPGPVDYPEPLASAATALCASASRYLCIQSPALDHRVFDQAPLVDAVSALARSGRQSEVRVLVADTRPLLQRGHRLLALARRLPTSISIRRLAEHPDWNGETVVIRDRDGLLLQPEAQQRGIYDPDSRARVKGHLELFNDLWRLGSEDAELRTLSL
jgi:predicted GNAT family N-acyltransferase